MKKLCPKCKKEKKFSEFKRHAKGKMKLSSWCRACTNAATLAKYHRDMLDPKKKSVRTERNKRMRYVYKYGITMYRKMEMLSEQNGKCSMCGTALASSTVACVDHDHKTGAVRSILCIRCNTGLSFVEDSKFLLSAKKYLEQHETQQAQK